VKVLGRLFYAVLYTGFIPFAPGTFGALVATLLCFCLMTNNLFSSLIMIALCVISSIISILVYPQAVVESGSDDPKTFVIDEFAGICATFIWVKGFLDMSMVMMLEVSVVGFLLFRFFDIAKPWFIGAIDKCKGAWPVLMDDIVAGLVSCVFLNLYLLLREGLLGA